MKRLPLLLLIAAMLPFGHAQTTTIYVATTGNDQTGNGTQGNPYKTPDRARQAASALTCAQLPAAVYFASGFYPLSSTWTFSSTDSGCSAARNITYTAQPGDATTPVISGGIVLNPANGYTWTNVSGNLWSVQLSSAQFSGGFSPEALYYNGVRRFRTRAGATTAGGLAGLIGSYYRVAAQVFACGSGGSSLCYDRFQYTAGDPLDSASTWTNYQPSQPTGQNNPCTPGNQNQAGDLEILIFEKWTMSRERISCVDTTHHIVYLEGIISPQNSDHGYIPNHRYVVENFSTGTSNLLPGQFFFDRTSLKLYYMVRAGLGENPNTDTVVIPVLAPGSGTGAVLSATGLQFVTFSNLQFSHDNYAPGSAGYAAIQSNTNLPAMVTCQDCSNTVWSGDTFTQTIGNALVLSTSSGTATPTGNTITGNYFYDLGSDGIVYGNLPKSTDTATNILQNGSITENLVQGYGRMYAGASGLEHPFGSGTIIQNNDVTDGYNTGIGVCIPNGNINCGGTGTNGGVATNITGSWNHVWNIGKGVTDDMGAFYIATYQATGNVVDNNRLHDVQDAQTIDSDGYGGNGIYIDNTTGNITAENNVVYRVTEHAVQNTQGPPGCNMPNLIQNNILAYARTGMFNEGMSGSIPNCLTETIKNNLFYFDRTDASSCGTGQDPNQCIFFVPSGCTVLDSAPLVAQDWVANLYWNTSLSTWGTTYGKAFFTITNATSCAPGNRSYKTFPQWQALGQDSGSAVFQPAFVNPTCIYSTAAACLSHSTQDNYRITNYPAGSQYPISSGNYFTTFCMSLSTNPPCSNAPGRLNPTFTPAAIGDTFTTTLFDTTTTAGNF